MTGLFVYPVIGNLMQKQASTPEPINLKFNLFLMYLPQRG